MALEFIERISTADIWISEAESGALCYMGIWSSGVHDFTRSARASEATQRRSMLLAQYAKAYSCSTSWLCSNRDAGTGTGADVRLVILYATGESAMTHHSMPSAAPPVFDIQCSAARSSVVAIRACLPSVFLRAPPNNTESAVVGDPGTLLGAPLLQRRQRIGGIRWG